MGVSQQLHHHGHAMLHENGLLMWTFFDASTIFSNLFTKVSIAAPPRKWERQEKVASENVISE